MATDDLGARVNSDAVTVAVNAGAAQVYYIQTDHLNTPRMIADQAGNTVWRWDNQEPFGSDLPNDDPGNTGNPFVFNLRFPGQYFDRETNLAYNWRRDYDLSIGRYIESDPIGLRGGRNTYAYVADNPLSYVDPFGLAKMCCRPVDNRFVGGFLRARHCFLVADDGNTYSLFPVFEGGGLLGKRSPNDDRDKSKILPNECSDCPADCGADQNQCLKDASDDYPVGGFSPIGTNSNTFAGTLARKCCRGGVPRGVHGAPGVGLNQPDPFPQW